MRWFIVVAAFALLISACGSDPEPGDGAADETGEQATADTEPVDETLVEAGEVVGEVLAPAIFPGGLAVGQVLIEGKAIDYVTVVPQGFEIGDPAPVLLAFPPGGQGLDLTRSVMEGTYLDEAVARGWVVISPAAPDGVLFFDGSEASVPGLMDWIEGWVELEGGRFHVAGISNGGLSSFRVAGQNADRMQSLVVFPGFPRTESDRDALAALVEVPIRMFAGGNDTGWVEPMGETKSALDALGADVTFETFPGEGHVVDSLRDGVRIFDELDALR